MISLQKLAERIYPESQCGFRAERSTIMVFSLQQPQEKCREQQMPFKNMPSTQELKESTFVSDQMAGSSTSPRLRANNARLSPGTCCLLMTQQLGLQEELQSVTDLISQACKDHQTEEDECRTGHRSTAGQYTIDDYELDAVCSSTSVPPSTTTSPWTQRSTRGL